MELRINFKPSKKISVNREDINGIFTMSGSGEYYIAYDNKTAVLVNYVKFNKKTKQTRKGSKTTSVIIRKKHWVAYTYRIPVDLIRAMGLKIVQKRNNFVITNK